MFTPKIGEDEPILTSIFSTRLVQPPTSTMIWISDWPPKKMHSQNYQRQTCLIFYGCVEIKWTCEFWKLAVLDLFCILNSFLYRHILVVPLKPPPLWFAKQNLPVFWGRFSVEVWHFRACDSRCGRALIIVDRSCCRLKHSTRSTAARLGEIPWAITTWDGHQTL